MHLDHTSLFDPPPPKKNVICQELFRVPNINDENLEKQINICKDKYITLLPFSSTKMIALIIICLPSDAPFQAQTQENVSVTFTKCIIP